MTAQLAPTPVFRATDGLGFPLFLGRLTTYQAGTLIPQATYIDSTQTTPNTNPIILNARGEAQIWLDPTKAYKFTLTDAFGNNIPGWPVDNITIGNANPSFNVIPTVDNLFTLGNASFSWANVFIGPNHAPVLDTVSGNIGYYARTAAEIAAAVTPTNFSYPPGAFSRYGVSTANADNGLNINNALKCNSVVYDDNMSGPSLYPVQSVLRFRSAGQILRGAGMGDNNTVLSAGVKFAPRTTLKWTGAAGGTVISLSDTAFNWSETTLQDIGIDGNALARYGVAYDDAVAGGCWRNILRNVTITNCANGTQPSAVYLGAAGANGFANDTILENCFLWASGIGVFNNGAVPQLVHCTIGVMSIAGLFMPGSGSETKVYGGVFHNNVVDIDVGSTGVVQNVSCSGTWFENSTTGIFKAHNSFSLVMDGCHLHTDITNVTSMMDFNGQAGHVVIKSWAAAGAGTYLIANTNAAFDYDFTGSGLVTNKGYKLRVAGANGLVRVDNANFDVSLTASTANSTGDGTVFALNANGVTAVYDLSAAVNANGVFTAPADGIYQFTARLELTGVLAAHNDAQLNLVIAGTSAGTHLLARFNPGVQLVAGSTEVNISGTKKIFMTKTDTANLTITVGGSTKVVGVLSGGAGTNFRTDFQGMMV